MPDLYVADFGIASKVQTLATRFTGNRGTQGYEAPEIRYFQAAFSQKSDVYAFGCILYRLCTLEDPAVLDDVEPMEISGEYSLEMLNLISSMLRPERENRPTATQVRTDLAAIGLKMFPTSVKNSPTCLVCRESFASKSQLSKHLQQNNSHRQLVEKVKNGFVDLPTVEPKNEPAPSSAVTGAKFKIRGVADAPPQHHYDSTVDIDEDVAPCVVCWRDYESKRKLYKHLYCNEHVRKRETVHRRLAEVDECQRNVHKRRRS